MIKNPLEEVLQSHNFTEKEQNVFMDIIRYAKSCQQTGQTDTLKSVINNKIEEVLGDENS